MKRDKNYPGVIDKTESEINEIIVCIKNSELPENIKNFVIKCIESALWFPMFLEKENISLRRLRTMIFGKGYSKNKDNNKTTNKKVEESTEVDSRSDIEPIPDSLPQDTSAIVSTEEKSPLSNSAPGKPGHGRMPNTVYQDCEEISLRLENLVSGSDCPLNCGGKLSQYSPGVLIRIKGQNF